MQYFYSLLIIGILLPLQALAATDLPHTYNNILGSMSATFAENWEPLEALVAFLQK